MDNNKGRKNIKKKLLRSIFWLLTVLFYIPAGLIFLSNQPLFQTFSARLATNILTKYTGYRFNVNTLKLSWADGIEAGGLVLYDHHNNPMIKIGLLKLKPVYSDTKMFGVIAKSVEMDSLDFRLGTYKGENNLNLIYFINSLSDSTAPPNPSAAPFKLKVGSILLKQSHFRLFNLNDTLGNGKAMDYSNMDFNNIYLKIKHFRLIDDSLNFAVKSLTTHEKSGLEVKNLRMDFVLSGTTIRGKNLKGNLNHSVLDADFQMNYRNWSRLDEILDSVQMKGDFKNTKLYMADLGYFSDVMFPMKDTLTFSGNIAGTIENFKAENMKIALGKNTVIDGDFNISKVVEYKKTHIQADIRNITANLCDIRNFLLPSGDAIEIPENLNCNDVFKVTGKFEGNYFNFASNLKWQIDNAPLTTGIHFKYSENDTLLFSLSLKGEKLALGHLFGLKNTMGKADVNGKINGRGNNFKDVLVSADITSKNLHLLNYKYDSVTFTGNFQHNKLEGTLSCNDKNLLFKTNGSIDFSGSGNYTAYADIYKANLKKLGLLNNDFSFSTKAGLAIQGNDVENLVADLNFDSTYLTFNDSTYFVDSISIHKHNIQHAKTIILKSDFLDGKLSGQFKLLDLKDNFTALINNYFVIDDNINGHNDSVNYMHVQATVKNDKLFKEQFLHGFTMEDNSNLKADIDFSKKKVNLLFSSAFMAWQNIRIKNSSLSVKTADNRLKLQLDAGHLVLKDSTRDDKQRVGMDSLVIRASALQNMLDFGMDWHNTDTTHLDNGSIKGYFFQQDSVNELTFDKAKVYIADTLWSLDKNNKILFDKTGIHFKNINLRGGSSKLSIQGEIPKVNGDSLMVKFSQWDLSNFDALTKSTGINFDGFIDGVFEISIYKNNPTIVSDLSINNFGLNGVLFGNARLMNTWNNIDNSVFVKMQIIRKGNAGTGKVFSLDGFYYPFKGDSSLRLTADFNRINIKFLNPLLSDLFHGIEGKGKGHLTISGTPAKPVINGKATLDRASLIVNYLNTRYSFSNFLQFRKNEISFDNIVVYDTLGNKGVVSGSLKHNYFSDFNYNIKVNTNKLLFVNTNRKMNELYYGSALVSGVVHLWGDPGSIHLNADATTVKGTDLNIPLDYVYDVSDNEYIRFIPPPSDSSMIDQEKKAITKEQQVELEKSEQNLGYDIKLNAKVNPAAKVNIYLPSQLGRIESQGDGTLKLNANSTGTFSMIGDYIIKKGYFHFTFKNLVSKRFDLVEGGKISWTGDPTGANLNIRGLYKVKTNIASLGVVIDSTASYKNKVDVYCYITLTNKLLNPTIRFSIDIPDADPDLKRTIFANLDTTNAAVVNEQVISLLVLGTFSYSNAGNVSLASSGYSILTNQLSSMLSQMSDKFDIGINYRPGDALSQEEFEVALSTQLFNDRLSINGNFGMTYDRSQGNASNIVGDVDVSYKLTEDGRWLLKAYNHSNVNSWYYYNNYDKISPYTQGVGVAYKKEFNNINELFTNNRKKIKIKKP